MNNKGFTLIELLAMLVVLALLMAVAIPNITGILGNQRKNVIRNDATTMVETAKVKVAKSESISKPGVNKCLVFSLDYLNDNDNINAGPNGGEYDQYESFVVYARIGNQYKYYVRLVEKNDNYKYGIALTELSELTENKFNNIGKLTDEDATIGVTASNGNIDAQTAYIRRKLNNDNLVVTNYYVRKTHSCEYYQGSYYDKDGKIVGTKAECLRSCTGVGSCS